ncbi:MAG: hypothetical protein A2Z34_02220 [Planctomycetes bacterium RBG_16_59_8]|nr:MAG: hypothetical protein A2Z34_02220 [Planctomycetes bacterium RBG_16_59_8]
MKRMRPLFLLFALLSVSMASPETPDIRALQQRVSTVVKEASPAFVFVSGGSGVLISDDGYFLTNHHVAVRMRVMTVRLASGELKEAEKIASDPVGDIALLKIKNGKNLPHVAFGDSDALEPGQYVVALGNPFGLADLATARKREPTATMGIVSAVHRYQGEYSDAIQTDASINPGNSGGPLLSLDGKLVGINGRIASRFFNRVNSGVGFAIPANQILRFLDLLKSKGEKGIVLHGQILGLHISREHTDGNGVLVENVREGSTAARAGFLKNDVIKQVEHYAVPGWRRFFGILGTYPAEAEITVTVEREGKSVKIPVTLDKKSAPTAAENARPRGYLGIGMEDTDDGVTITNVVPETPAEVAGLQVGDIVTHINGAAVATAERGIEFIHAASPGDELRIRIRREGRNVTVRVVLAPRPN